MRGGEIYLSVHHCLALHNAIIIADNYRGGIHDPYNNMEIFA
jgi:hypothetical protein